MFIVNFWTILALIVTMSTGASLWAAQTNWNEPAKVACNQLFLSPRGEAYAALSSNLVALFDDRGALRIFKKSILDVALPLDHKAIDRHSLLSLHLNFTPLEIEITKDEKYILLLGDNESAAVALTTEAEVVFHHRHGPNARIYYDRQNEQLMLSTLNHLLAYDLVRRESLMLLPIAGNRSSQRRFTHLNQELAHLIYLPRAEGDGYFLAEINTEQGKRVGVLPTNTGEGQFYKLDTLFQQRIVPARSGSDETLITTHLVSLGPGLPEAFIEMSTSPGQGLPKAFTRLRTRLGLLETLRLLLEKPYVLLDEL